jgi:N-acetylmuramoyl-L-alanine amidase
LNDTAIGIEMVNLGDQPFTEDQIDSVSNLCRDLMLKFKIKPRNVVSHADIAPGRKFDPSGYFDWKRFYKHLEVFSGLFESKLKPEEQRDILLDSTSGKEKSDEILSLQKNLSDYGYKISQTGMFENETRFVVEAFNRHFSPEIFVKEVVKNEKIIQRPDNQKWYKISQERLDFLLANK